MGNGVIFGGGEMEGNRGLIKHPLRFLSFLPPILSEKISSNIFQVAGLQKEILSFSVFSFVFLFEFSFLLN